MTYCTIMCEFNHASKYEGLRTLKARKARENTLPAHDASDARKPKLQPSSHIAGSGEPHPENASVSHTNQLGRLAQGQCKKRWKIKQRNENASVTWERILLFKL